MEKRSLILGIIVIGLPVLFIGIQQGEQQPTSAPAPGPTTLLATSQGNRPAHLQLIDGTAMHGSTGIVTSFNALAGCGLVTLDTSGPADVAHVYYLDNGTVIHPGSRLEPQITGRYVSHGCSIKRAETVQACHATRAPYRLCQVEDGQESLCDLAEEGNTVLNATVTGTSSMACAGGEWMPCNATTAGRTVTVGRQQLTCIGTADDYRWTYTHPVPVWRVDATVRPPLKDIDSLNGTVIAVGSNGSAVHLSKDGWQVVETPVESYLYEVELTGPQHAIAVGNNGAVIRWDGEDWDRVDVPTTARLTSVEVEGNRTWITGGRITQRGELVRDWNSTGLLLYSNGSGWQRFTPPTDNFLVDIDLDRDGTGLAVGFLGTVYDVTGTRMTTIPQSVTTVRNFIDVARGPSTWIIAGSPHHTGGKNWFIRKRNLTFTVYNKPFHGLAKYYEIAFAKGETVAVGKFMESHDPPIKIAVRRWNGTTWERIPVPTELLSFKSEATPIKGYLMGLTLQNRTHGYAVGESLRMEDSGLILRRRLP